MLVARREQGVDVPVVGEKRETLKEKAKRMKLNKSKHTEAAAAASREASPVEAVEEEEQEERGTEGERVEEAAEEEEVLDNWMDADSDDEAAATRKREAKAFEGEEVTRTCLATPSRARAGGVERVRRSPGSRKKWLDRLLQHQERMVSKKGGPSKLLRALQHYSSTPSMQHRLSRCRRNLTAELKNERAESRPFPSEIAVRSSGGQGVWRGRSEQGLGEERCLGSASEATLPPLPLTVYVGDSILYTLRQSRVGGAEGGPTSWGPGMWWWDQWQGWGWTGPVSPVYFCLNCQLGRGGSC